VIEENEVLGNTNGIVVVAGVQGNVFRRNVVVGNPPIQVSNSFPAGPKGVDIRNGAVPGTNTFEDNVCLTGVNAPCPALGRRHKHGKDEDDDKNDDKKAKDER
jgi:hypothetical protein